MDEPTRAWVGAFIEADGCVTIVRNCKGQRIRPLISVAQVEVEPISVLLRATGVGRVHCRARWATNLKIHPKGQLVWAVQSLEDAKSLAVQYGPYSTKLQRYLEVLESA